jgi:hypothetical protein
MVGPLANECGRQELRLTRTVPTSSVTARARASGRLARPERQLGRESNRSGAMLMGDWLAALSPVTPRLAQPRGAGDPPHCDGPAIRAHERAGSDRRRAPEKTVQTAIHVRQPRPEPAPLHPTRTTVAIRAGDPAHQHAARLDTHDQWQLGTARRRPE